MKYLKKYLLLKPGTVGIFPFGDDVQVFMVKNKMFALMGQRDDLMMLNLNCDPYEAVGVRDVFLSITEGYHMDKKHWIPIYFDGTVPVGEVQRLIDNSFFWLSVK